MLGAFRKETFWVKLVSRHEISGPRDVGESLHPHHVNNVQRVRMIF